VLINESFHLRSFREFLKLAVVLMASGWAGIVSASLLELEVIGVSEIIADNVKAHVGSSWTTHSQLSTERRRQRFRERAVVKSAVALRPYGYYFPAIESGIKRTGDNTWLMTLNITPGDPVTVSELELQITGEGAEFERLEQWRADWPLQPGAVLDQTVWDEEKFSVLDLAEEQGFLLATFTREKIELNLESGKARLFLVMETGPRAVMGKVEFKQDAVRHGVLEPIPRFQAGDPYRRWLVDKLRTDLWRTGFFEDIDVTEIRHLDQHPPVVDFEAALTRGKKDRLQGTIGYGTDTQLRSQYRWKRHRISNRGDSIDLGVGWQQRSEEFRILGDYRLPRRVETQQFWTVTTLLKSEATELEVSDQNSSEPVIRFTGRVEDFSLRLGKSKVRNLSFSREQIVESMFIAYLHETDAFGNVAVPVESSQLQLLDEGSQTDKRNNSISVGMDWNWPVIRGSGFQTVGHHERAWLFTSQTAWGSDRTFSQAYFSSRWHFLLGDRWKLLLRGEVGYSDADVDDLFIDTGDRIFEISATELPYLYRFKAGGGSSVRGYEFESLSNNSLGSNHIFSASAELEYNFMGDWSAALFYDTGNAFNDWNNKNLKTGVGAGIRWNTLAGAIRVDFAQAQDISGKPWEIHLSIGTPLL
jgi:translocation and assembly module TamA